MQLVTFAFADVQLFEIKLDKFNLAQFYTLLELALLNIPKFDWTETRLK